MSGRSTNSSFTAPLPLQLANFVGPKAENSEMFKRLLDTVVDDNHHWRRNYFPQDAVLYSSTDRRRMADPTDALEDFLRQLVADLRRSFPFHNPRYLAHQQSETSMASVLGAVAGMLYNANNVTSESGNATLIMEIEATSALLEMIGYAPPPEPPPVGASPEALAAYSNRLDEPFGWCHLCSGGTTANLEALWTARNVRYRTLAIARAAVALNHGDILVSTLGGDRVSVGDLWTQSVPAGSKLEANHEKFDRTLLGLHPDAALDLHAELVTRTALKDPEKGPQELQRSIDAFSPPWFEVFHEYPPLIFASGAAHYSVSKSLDVLGLGPKSLVKVDTDARFRIDVADLADKLEAALDVDDPEGKVPVPLAVVGIVGTTEEGAIDPVHEILALRERYAERHGQSFWVHADAAWGGYFLTLLRTGPRERFVDELSDALDAHGLPPADPTNVDRSLQRLVSTVPDDADRSTLHSTLEQCHRAIAARQWDVAQESLGSFRGAAFGPDQRTGGREFADRNRAVREFVRGASRPLSLQVTGQPPFTTMPCRSFDSEVMRSLDALRFTDSVTVDPHKMGFQPYACGAIAFKRDGVREFVRQSAPYITSFGSEPRRQPLLHLEKKLRKVEAPATYTLEGSRPSSPAAGLWLSTKVLPLDRSGHGELVAATWRAAQDLFTWIEQFPAYRARLEPTGNRTVSVVPLTRSNLGAAQPDTNLVIYGVAVADPDVPLTLHRYNQLTDAVYAHFSISAEAGDDRHSYGQPFFVSTTPFQIDNYAKAAVAPAAEALGIHDFDEAYQGGAEMKILRSTVMNPYLAATSDRAAANSLFADFMIELHRAVVGAWEAIQTVAGSGGSDGS